MNVPTIIPGRSPADGRAGPSGRNPGPGPCPSTLPSHGPPGPDSGDQSAATARLQAYIFPRPRGPRSRGHVTPPATAQLPTSSPEPLSVDF